MLLALVLAILFLGNSDSSPHNWQEFKFTAGVGIINYEDYLEKAVLNFVDKLENSHISGSKFQIYEHETDVNITMPGYGVVNETGTVSLHNGFLNKIGVITRLKNEQNNLKMEVSTDIYMKNIEIVLDIEYDFRGNAGFGTTAMALPEIRFLFKIWKDVNTGEVKSSIELTSTDCTKATFKTYPYDKYMQLAIKGIEGTKPFCDKLEESIRDWELNKLLQEAVGKIGFAVICYYC